MKKLKCLRCHYEWWPKNPEVRPKVCPVCKHRKWDEPRPKPQPEEHK
jgi:hypothetical protein